MVMIFIVSSSIYGNVGFYCILPFFNYTELQNVKNKSIGNFIFIGSKTLITFFTKHLLCRIFFCVTNKNNLYNKLALLSFINFYSNFVLDKFIYCNFFNGLILNLNNIVVFGGICIYKLYFFLINRFLISLFYKYFYGNFYLFFFFLNFGI